MANDLHVKVPSEDEEFYLSEIPVKQRVVSSCVLLGMICTIGIFAACVGFYGFAADGNNNDMCLHKCTVVAGGDSFERQSAVIYENLIEIVNAEEIPVKSADQDELVETGITDTKDKQIIAAEPIGLTYHCMTTIYGKVISIGGKYTEDKIFKMELRSWKEYADIEKMDFGRYEHGCGYSERSNATVVCGGSSAVLGEIKECEILTSDGEWKQYGTLTIARKARPIVVEAMTSDGPRMMVIGGKDTDNNILASTEVKSLSGEFREGPSLPTGIAMAAGISFDDSTYIFGGVNSTGLSATIYKFEYKTNEWITYGKLSKPRSAHAVIRISDFQGVVVGGQHVDGELVHSETYDWRKKQTFVAERTGLARPGISGVQIASEIYF